MTQSLMPQLKGRKALEKTMVVMVFLLLVGLSQAGLPCKTDAECRRSVCIFENCKPRSAAGGPCETNSQCLKTTDTCINNLCSSLSPAGGPCASADKCLVPQSTCPNGICLSPSGGQCSANNQCAAVSDSCIENICKEKADAGETCDANDNADCGTPNNICDGTSCAFDLSLLRWEGNKAITTPRSTAASIAVGDYLYVFGGQVYGDGNAILTDSVERYDPSENVWVSKANIPVAVWEHSVVAVGDFVYLIAGADEQFSPKSYFFRYDTINDVWTTDQDLPQLPSRISSVAATVVGTTIYTFGGIALQSTKRFVYTFDTAAPEQGWSNPTNLPSSKYYASAVAVNNLIYIAGGSNTKTYVYDTNTPNVAPVDLNLPINSDRIGHSSIYIPFYNKIFLVGGLIGGSSGSTVESLDLTVTPLIWTVEPTGALNLFFTASSSGLIRSRLYATGVNFLNRAKVPSSLLFSLDFSAPPLWLPYSAPPTPVFRMAFGKIGSTIVTAGGVDQKLNSVIQTNQYNIASDTWETFQGTLAPSNPASAVLGSELFAIGGESGGAPTGQTLVLSSDLNAWNSRSFLNVPRSGICAASQGTKIYAYGGHDSSNTVLDTMEIFETGVGKPGYNVWTDVTSLSKTSGNSPTPVQFCAAVSTGTKILIFGGITETTADTVTGLIQSFDIASEKWDAPIQTAITPRYFLSATVLNGFAIVSGGTIDNVYPLATVEAFNVFTGKIKKLPDMPSPRLGHGSVTDGDSVIVVGGQNGDLIASVEKLRIPIV